MDKANSQHNGDSQAHVAQAQSKFDLRERERELRIDDLTKESFEDLIPKKAVKLVDIEEAPAPTEIVDYND